MKKLLLLSVASSIVLTPFAAQSTTNESIAKQAFMIDATTHAVLFNKAGDELMHPSSMSKLMTLYVLFQKLKSGRLKPEDKFTVSEKAWRMQGSKTFVELGSEISVDELIHGIIIQSGNDACIVVAEGISGSEEAFVKELNRVAKEIGLTKSNFTNSTGMPDENHLMTAHDLAILSDRLIEDFPEFYHYFSIREHTYNKIKQQNRNRLLGASLGVDGLKTGHTEDGGYGIALSAKQGDRRLILVINGMASDNGRVQEGDRLLRYGFREFENKTIVKNGQKIAEVPVWFGKKETLPLVADKDVVATLPVNAANDTSFVLKYNSPVPAPVAQGAHVADLVVKSKGGGEQVIPLKAAEEVPKLSAFGHMFAVIKHFIMSPAQ
jgi:serine-type D-Ala-D-Ala carboxypeptidase (penicillin-binding protein 5/6)